MSSGEWFEKCIFKDFSLSSPFRRLLYHNYIIERFWIMKIWNLALKRNVQDNNNNYKKIKSLWIREVTPWDGGSMIDKTLGEISSGQELQKPLSQAIRNKPCMYKQFSNKLFLQGIWKTNQSVSGFSGWLRIKSPGGKILLLLVLIKKQIGIYYFISVILLWIMMSLARAFFIGWFFKAFSCTV